jgi:transposase
MRGMAQKSRTSGQSNSPAEHRARAGVQGRGRREVQAHTGAAARAGDGAGRRAGRVASGWGEDQCWTLARITEVIRSRFRVGYTLAEGDLLLHQIGWSVQVPARQAAVRLQPDGSSGNT